MSWQQRDCMNCAAGSSDFRGTHNVRGVVLIDTRGVVIASLHKHIRGERDYYGERRVGIENGDCIDE